MARISAKEKIIKSTLDVMEGRGYRSVSVDEIITHAGVSKGSFYHSFKSKEMPDDRTEKTRNKIAWIASNMEE